MTAVGANFEIFYFTSGVATGLRCGGIFDDSFVAYFLEIVPVKNV